MFYALKDRLQRARFSQRCDGILETPPVVPAPDSDVLLVSQLQHKDVLMYLLAVKSFCSHVPVRRVHVIDDGSLTAADRRLLKDHVSGCAISSVADHRSSLCPRGGTWERLLAISEFAQNSYVIQLDSDTLTLGPLDEIDACVASGTAFTIGTWRNQRVERMSERHADANALQLTGSSHVQLLAEAHLDCITGYESLNYIRGCSGFAGFPRGTVSKRFLEDCSREMDAALGVKWSAWGSEQFMSNVVVANAPRRMVLPFPKYADCSERYDSEVTRFIHFVGSCRFVGDTYSQLAKTVIEKSAAKPTLILRPLAPN